MMAAMIKQFQFYKSMYNFLIIQIFNITLLFFVRFMEKNKLGNDCRWMIKLPYKTNQTYYPVSSNIKSIKSRLKSLSKKYSGVIPYVFMQRCLTNKMEKKVVCLNEAREVPMYFAHIDRGSKGRNPINMPESTFFDFASLAIKTAKRNCPDLLCDGILRIDIMYCPILHRLFVNEFESLEAMFTGDGEREVSGFLTRYHYHKLSCCVDILKSK